MMFPTVHLNGTSVENLIEGYEEAYTAVDDAIKVVCMNAPNARDYYVVGPEAYPVARAEHEDRVARLVAVQKELEQIVGGLWDQQEARKRQKGGA